MTVTSTEAVKEYRRRCKEAGMKRVELYAKRDDEQLLKDVVRLMNSEGTESKKLRKLLEGLPSLRPNRNTPFTDWIKT